jgi:hypothetical protein
MKIKDLVRTDVPVCVEDMPLTDVYSLLQGSGNDHVVVLDSSLHRKPIGIVNEHSICEQVIGRRRDPRGLTAGNVLSTSLLCIVEDTEIGSLTISPGAVPDAIISVDRRRQFSGSVDPRRLSSEVARENLRRGGMSLVAVTSNNTVRPSSEAAAVNS